MSDDGSPEIIAHRGFAGTAPENTLAAVRRAVAGPGRASMIEVDVMPTGDGTVVCFHDDHLHETGTSRGITDAQGRVWETADDVVLDAEVLDSGETIPRLADVLAALPDEIDVNVELKNPGSADLRPGEVLDPDELEEQRRLWDPFVDDVIEIVAQYDNDVLFSSFCEAALAATRDVAAPSSIPVGVLAGNSLEDCLTVADRYDAEAVHPPWDLVQGTPFAGTSEHIAESPEIDVVAEAHDAGRAVNVWTVDTWYRADQLRRAGVDGLIADYPCLLPAAEKDDSGQATE